MKKQLMVSGTKVIKGAPQPFKVAATLVVAGMLLSGTPGDAQPPDPPPKPPEKPAAKTPPISVGGVPYDPFPKPPAPRRKKPVVDVSREFIDHKYIGDQMPSVLRAAKYDELEQKADKFRKSKEAFSNGEWTLTTFYNGVTKFGEDDPGDEVVASLRKWAAARPTSITAQVALAQGLVNYAWVARGTGGGNTVSPEQWEVYRERLQEARLVLREAKKLDAKCPHWWAVAQSIALGQSWDREAYDGLVKEAIAFEPNYNLYYFGKSNFLLGRWYGEPGEPEEFAVEAADYLAKKKSPEEGDMLYARIFWFLEQRQATEISYTHPAVSYERMARGFQALLKLYPDNVAVMSAWMKHCALTATPETMAQRKAKARELLKEIDNRSDLWVFYNDDEFAKYQKWALKD